MADPNCKLCFGRGWFLCPGYGGRMTPMACDKCKPATPSHQEALNRKDDQPAHERSAAPTGAVGAPGSNKPESDFDSDSGSSIAAQGMAQDAARLDWLDAQGTAYGFEDMHEGNRWSIDGPFRTVREAIDAALRAVPHPHQPTGERE